VRSIPKTIQAALAVAILALAAVTPALHVGAICSTSPTAVNDIAMTVDEPIVIDVLANDADPEGEALTVTIGSDSCPGAKPTVDDYQLVYYDPTGVVNTPCTINYTIQDESGNSASAKITVTGDPSLIFRDSFESGDRSKWSSCTGSCL